MAWNLMKFLKSVFSPGKRKWSLIEKSEKVKKWWRRPISNKEPGFILFQKSPKQTRGGRRNEMKVSKNQKLHRKNSNFQQQTMFVCLISFASLASDFSLTFRVFSTRRQGSHRIRGGGGAYVAVSTLENLCDNLPFLVFNWNLVKVKWINPKVSDWKTNKYSFLFQNKWKKVILWNYFMQ